MDKTKVNPLDEQLQEIAAEAPEQTAEHKWVFRPRQNPKWGTVERAGLIVGRGDNKKVIPPDEVYKLAALGCTQKEIAIWFGIPEETVRYNFADYIAKGREETRQRLRMAMLDNAIKHRNAALQIFLAKNMLGMSDSPVDSDGDRVLPWSTEGNNPQ